MADQLSKPLTGQFRFLIDSDRLATLANLGVSPDATEGTTTAVADGATTTLDWAVGNSFSATPAGATTIAFANISEKRITLLITGGAASAITWPTVTWSRGITPQDPAVGEFLLIEFVDVAGTVYGSVITRSQAGANDGSGVSLAVTQATTTNLDWRLSNVFSVALTANTTFAFLNTVEKQVDLFVTVTGTPTIAWPTVRWNGGTAPTVPATAKTGWYRFRKVGAVFYGEAISVNLS